MAQTALNIETLSGNTLAYTNLDVYAIRTDKGKYKVKTVLLDESNKGPFTNLNIVDKAVFSKNGTLRVLVTYALQTQRINWATEKGQLTGVFGEGVFKESIKNEGGALTGTATLIFDEKNMNLLSQSSNINENVSNEPKTVEAGFIEWHTFALKYLKPRLVTKINWTNADCKSNNCTTGEIWEM